MTVLGDFMYAHTQTCTYTHNYTLITWLSRHSVGVVLILKGREVICIDILKMFGASLVVQ